MKRILALVLLLPTLTLASPKHFYKDKQFWLGVGIIGASVALDTHSSCRGFDAGYHETSLIARGNTSCGKQIAIESGAFVFYSTMHYLDWKYVVKDEPNKYWRFAGRWTTPVIVSSIHLPAAIHNYKQPGVL